VKLFSRCDGCGKIEVQFYEKMSLGEHLLLAIVTAGLWLPFWFYFSWKYRTRGECERCGKTRVTLD